MNTNTRVIEHKIHLINNKIDLFQDKLSRMPKRASSKFMKATNEIEMKRHKLQNKFKHLKKSSEVVSSELEAGVEMAWDDLNLALASAKEKLKQEMS